MTTIIAKKTKIPIDPTAFEEVEGQFIEKFGRLPNAQESMTLYAIEIGQCPLCGEKHPSKFNSKERALDIAAHVYECFDLPE